MIDECKSNISHIKSKNLGKTEFYSLLLQSAIHTDDEEKLRMVIEEIEKSALLVDALKMANWSTENELRRTNAMNPFQCIVRTTNIKVCYLPGL